MSTLAEHPSEMTMAADDFQALEERVLRTVELLKGERELRFSVEQHASRLTTRVDNRQPNLSDSKSNLPACSRSGKRCASASNVCSSILKNWASESHG